MKILNVITSMNPKGGGPAEGLRQLARVADGAGLPGMEVVSFDPPGSDAVRDVAVPVHAIGPAKGSYQHCPAYKPWLRANASRFDAVLVRGNWQYHGFATRSLLHGTDIPYFVFPHGMLDPWFKRNYPLKHLKKWLYWPWGEYRVLRDARAVMFTCEEERRLARESFWLYRVNECVINYGTARPEDDPEKQREVFLNQFPELRGKRILLFLSRIHEKKGCDFLIRAFGECSRQPGCEDLRLIIAGPCADPAYLESLQRLVTAHCLPHTVHFPGMLSGDLKWGAFRAAEAFVLPSHQENFGIAVAEALACGLPVLISNKVNIWREIELDAAGQVGDDTVEGTREVLNNWLSMRKDDCQRMRTAAKICFDRRFEINRAAESLYQAISRMITQEEGRVYGRAL